MTLVEVETRLTALEAELAELRAELERTQIAAAMKRGIAQIERGEGLPAIEAVKALKRHIGATKAACYIDEN